MNVDEAQVAMAHLRSSGIVPGQKYRHCETGTVYLVIAVGLYEPDLEPLIHYRDAADEYGIVWTRQLHVFDGMKPLDGTLVKRFQRVE
jgi:hypothetical protein